MKLNMIVVMTIWLPRVACSQPGMKAQAAPNSAEKITAKGMSRIPGRNWSATRTANPAPSPPI